MHNCRLVVCRSSKRGAPVVMVGDRRDVMVPMASVGTFNRLISSQVLHLFSVYDHDVAVAGKRFSSSMTVTREGRLSDHCQKTSFLSFSIAPGAKLGTMMPATPLAVSIFASSHEGGILP